MASPRPPAVTHLHSSAHWDHSTLKSVPHTLPLAHGSAHTTTRLSSESTQLCCSSQSQRFSTVLMYNTVLFCVKQIQQHKLDRWDLTVCSLQQKIEESDSVSVAVHKGRATQQSAIAPVICFGFWRASERLQQMQQCRWTDLIHTSKHGPQGTKEAADRWWPQQLTSSF